MSDSGGGAVEKPNWLAGNVGGAWRIGGTVHRATGPWTPAVHALLGFLGSRVAHTPRVLGFDEQGLEVLTFLPGRVVDAHPQAAAHPPGSGLTRAGVRPPGGRTRARR